MNVDKTEYMDIIQNRNGKHHLYNTCEVITAMTGSSPFPWMSEHLPCDLPTSCNSILTILP